MDNVYLGTNRMLILITISYKYVFPKSDIIPYHHITHLSHAPN